MLQTVPVNPVPAVAGPWVQFEAPVPPITQPFAPDWKSSVNTVVRLVPLGQLPGTPGVNERTAEVVPTRVEICAPLVFHTYSTNYGGPLRKSDSRKNGIAAGY